MTGLNVPNVASELMANKIMMLRYLFILIVLLIPMSAAFADSDNCWFILCWFALNDELTTEEIYVQAAQNSRERGISAIKNEISELREDSKTISNAQESGMISGADKLIYGMNDRAEFLQLLIDEQEDVKNNPEKYYTKQDLVSKAMKFYKFKPDGTACDDDRRWVEKNNACIRQERAGSQYFYYDLEWLRYYKLPSYN